MFMVSSLAVPNLIQPQEMKIGTKVREHLTTFSSRLSQHLMEKKLLLTRFLQGYVYLV